MRSGEVVGGRFELEHLAGSGGMGEVYRARDRVTGHPVAVKRIYRRGVADVQRFEREAQALASLEHPGIVRYVGHAIDEQGAYLVMEWLDGESLEARLARARLTLAESVAVACSVAEALNVAHAKGVVHRDLKPSNVFLVEGSLETVKIIDFGLVRSESSEPLTATGATLGTPAYMAPEQVRRPSDVDHRADLFSLGCVLFRCVTGRAPNESNDAITVLFARAAGDTPRASSLVEALPDVLDDIIARLLASEPSERPLDPVGELRAVELEVRSLGIGWNVPSSKPLPANVPSTLGTMALDSSRKEGQAWRPNPTPDVDARASTALEAPRETRPSAEPSVRPGMHPATAALLTILGVVVMFGACGSGCFYCVCVAPKPSKSTAPQATGQRDAGRPAPARPAPHPARTR